MTLIKFIGSKHATSILKTISEGYNRFNKIVEQIPGLTHRALSYHLKTAQELNLIRVKVINQQHKIYTVSVKCKVLLQQIAIIEELEQLE